MVQSKATTVAAYLKELPADRRKTISAVREVVRKALPKGYVEAMNWGAICYEIPLSRYPETYNKQPLMYAGLASQKNHCGLYLMCVYSDKKHEAQLRKAFKDAGKKLDMGKSCVRFQTPDDLPLDAIGKIIGSVSVEEYIGIYEASRTKTAAGKKKAAKKTGKKKAAKKKVIKTKTVKTKTGKKR